MVCATENRIGSKIAGGFVLLNVAALMIAWRACQARPLGIGDFRTWLACHELVARRCRIHETRDRSPSYHVAELARLLDVTERRARASVRRLEAAGLIEWSGEAIGFPIPPGPPEGLEDTIGRGQGSVAIPRRMLRFLAAGARPALIAAVFGLLLRCLSRRKGGFDGWGRVKASWIARVFGVDLRRVKAARRELVELGWIEPEPADQRSERRWGRPYRINLAWEPLVKVRDELLPKVPPAPDQAKPDGPSLPPLPADERPAIATSSVNQEPLRERIQNQEPAGGPTGSSIKGSGNGEKTLPSPRLDDVRLEDLKDTSRLLTLYDQGVAKGLVGSSEADRLKFVAAAEHALAIGKNNPPGLFAYLIRGACYRYVTGADEDAARRRLKLHDFGPPRDRIPSAPPALSSSSPSRTIEPGPSDDARIVKAIREAAIKAGLFRDPWPAFQARYPEWTRGRWDAALVELGLA
jgi:hypothetical protein